MNFKFSVLHPGLPSHPQHELALKQSSGHSGLISFYIKNGSGDKFLQNLKVFSLAESLGGYESLAELPYVTCTIIFNLLKLCSEWISWIFRFSMTHASVPADLRLKLGITEGFVR